MNKGEHFESQVEALCSKAYLSDFVVRSPFYQKQDGQKKEAADVLLLMNDAVLMMQLKTRDLPSSNCMTDIEAGRLRKTIYKGIAQTKTCFSEIRNRTLIDLKNSRGITLPFHYDEVKSHIGIVLIHSYNDTDQDYVNHRIYHPRLHMEYGYPVHVFRFSDFVKITDELSTLPDLIDYLKMREAAFSKTLIPSPTPELDLLGLYATQHPRLEELVTSDTSFVIEQGLWTKFQSMEDIIKKRDVLRKMTSAYDHIIEKVHEGIGFSLNAETGISVEAGVDTCDPKEYAAIARELSSLRQLNRHLFIRKMIEKMKLADTQPEAFFALNLEDRNGAILFFSSSVDRITRRERMATVTQLQVAGRDLSWAVGISTEQFTTDTRSFDFAMVIDMPKGMRSELKAYWQQLAVKSSRSNADEWDIVRESLI